MPEYIEKNVAIARLTAIEIAIPYATMTDAKGQIADTPAADVVPVVRCKDCKYSRPLNKSEKERFVEGVLMCTNSEVSEYGITDVWDTHFCSYGERKDGGTNNA